MLHNLKWHFFVLKGFSFLLWDINYLLCVNELTLIHFKKPFTPPGLRTMILDLKTRSNAHKPKKWHFSGLPVANPVSTFKRLMRQLGQSKKVDLYSLWDLCLRRASALQAPNFKEDNEWNLHKIGSILCAVHKNCWIKKTVIPQQWLVENICNPFITLSLDRWLQPCAWSISRLLPAQPRYFFWALTQVLKVFSAFLRSPQAIFRWYGWPLSV